VTSLSAQRRIGRSNVTVRAVTTAAPMATGAALVAHILLGVPLWGTAAVTVAIAAAAWTALVGSMPAPHRARLVTRAKIGAACGLLATMAYDAVRYGLVSAADWSLSPFDAFSVFGRALLGEDITTMTAVAAGVAFHLINGTGFAIGYALLVRQPSATTAVGFALGLETLMLLLYPRFLDISSFDEFATMSGIGHVAYGLTLGVAARGLYHWAGNPPAVWEKRL
jgi:hypothetical protein